MAKIEYLLVTNRGPDFETSNTANSAIGGTKDAYSTLAKGLSKKWICIYHGDREGLKSDYYGKLDPLFVDKELYENYYYKYVSEYLYPNLLGFKDIAISKDYFVDFKKVALKLSKKITLGEEKNLIICDYHLFLLPSLLDETYNLNFFWFIPFMDYKEYDHDLLKEILLSLSKCKRLFFLTEKYKQNFVSACKNILGVQNIKTEIISLALGPDYNYFNIKKRERKDFDKLIRSKLKLNVEPKDKIILNVSRMDFVKNVTFLIKAYEYFKSNFEDKNSHLLLVLPNHRDNSPMYKLEKEKILNIIDNSLYKNKIHVLNENLSKKELRILYSFSDVLTCCSKYDGLPLTPLEYLLTKQQDGSILISNTIGCADFIDCDRYIYKYNDMGGFSTKLQSLIKNGNKKLTLEQNKIIVSKIESISLQNWMKKINNIL